MKKIGIAIALLISSVAFADTREEIIADLMEAQGLLQIFEDQLEMARSQSREQGNDLVHQMMSGLNPTPEYSERIDAAFNEFMEALMAPWSASEIVSVWARYYGPHFSDDELAQLLEYYKSPLGRKEVAASREAMAGYSNYLNEASKPILEKAVQDYVQKLQLIAKECKCRR